KPGDNFRAGYREAFPGAKVERNAFPAPGIDFELQRGKCFSLRVLCHSILVAVPAELAADQVLLDYGPNRFQHLDLFVANGFAVQSGGRLHSQIGKDLKKMILNNVAEGACLIVENSPALDSEIFSHRDLDAVDVIAIPERLQKRVREAKDQQV